MQIEDTYLHNAGSSRHLLRPLHTHAYFDGLVASPISGHFMDVVDLWSQRLTHNK